VTPLTTEEQAAADEAEEKRVEEALKEMQRMEVIQRGVLFRRSVGLARGL